VLQARHDVGAGPMLDIIAEGARRIAGIVSALDDHARPADGDSVSLFDVSNGLDATLMLLRPRMREIQVHRSYELSRPVGVPPRELNQVFLNLLDNAVRAGPRNIWIRTAEADERACITFSDDGPGVPHQIARKIFDPFFTTRPVGEGTGLGLYLSRRIVTELGGDIRLEPREGGGASFLVELPIER
jgi:two-component system, NtrC family, sensor kinase